MELLLSAFLGFIGITILDRRWFDSDHKKIEKGYEVIEHYHWGIGLIAIGIIIITYLPYVAYLIFGAGMGLVYHEAKQKNYFAHKSTHFLSSTIIGVVLCIVTITIYFLYSMI
jgi:hypothetical protein